MMESSFGRRHLQARARREHETLKAETASALGGTTLGSSYYLTILNSSVMLLFCRSPLLRSTLRIPLTARVIVLLPPSQRHSPQPQFASRYITSLHGHWYRGRTNCATACNMPPKQATLGYVKSGQQTIGCATPSEK